MNKEVIYIEPEDDITDIISKIEKSKEKIVALVPPKKASAFRSAVNIKLISKSAGGAEKNVVLVTTDPSIIKLAAVTRLPVTKNLQTPPVIPKLEEDMPETASEEVIEDDTVEAIEPTENPDEETPDEEKKEDDKKDKPKKTNKFLEWIKAHKKLTIFGCIAFLLLIIFLIWAFVIAPSATVTVGIQTSSGNFSENISFVKTLSEENASEGKFYLEEKKLDSVAKVEFEATGSVNVGDSASGTLTVTGSFGTWANVAPGTINVPSGAVFTYNGQEYINQSSTNISVSTENDCAGFDDKVTFQDAKQTPCLKSATITIVASNAGSSYNVSGTRQDWTSSVPLYSISNSTDISGGTDNVITIVQESDVEKAKEKLATSSVDESKSKLLETIDSSSLVITTSFKQTTGDSVSKPAVGDQVENGVKPTLTVTTTASVYVIDKTKIEEFIKAKANLGEYQTIYQMNDPFVENFSETSSGYTGKLKTSYQSGPSITENEIVEKIKGKGFGDAQHELKNINGIASVSIQGSYPWVTSIPNDTDKITVNLETKE